MKTEVLFNHNHMVPNMPVPMVIHMVVISMFSLAKKENNNLGNMHNKNI